MSAPAVTLAGSGLWSAYAALPAAEEGDVLRARIKKALAGTAVAVQRRRLEAIGSRLIEQPILWKYLPGPEQEQSGGAEPTPLQRLRLFFPVEGARAELAAGDIVALVLLYDTQRETALYAHPVHAGPGANPLLRHTDGPMAHPKAQRGASGDLATRRLLEHKRAIWDAHEREAASGDAASAARRWRARYAWSLVRLYFCERCPACRWGSPSFEGAGARFHRSDVATIPRRGVALTAGELESILESPTTQVEIAYAARGGSRVGTEPLLVAAVDDDHLVVVLPTDAEWIDAGVLVAVAATLHRPSGQVIHAHCLAAGEEPEMLLRRPEVLGLPALADPQAFSRYAAWRRDAWSRFWLAELELGLHAASQQWLAAFWEALAEVFGAVK